ncbi:hypothetical protein MNBD_GAMMA08-2175 [hydrothermal vent metagenome]|uniref:Uncharacterized protein n=1 Tax=hydrothermal vent metagenome TaxID=652676 RepID=A0A3B0X705_9ZZZZ
MQYQVSPEDLKKSRIPHEVFLTNLIFNHVLVFVAIMSASSLTHLIVFIPIFSFASLSYLFWGAHRAKTKSSWYVSGHWQVAAKRSRFFLMMLTAAGSILGLIYMASGGDMKPQHWAFAGASLLPVMVSVLGLIIFESESLHQAKTGILPKWVSERFSENALVATENMIEETIDESVYEPVQQQIHG